MKKSLWFIILISTLVTEIFADADKFLKIGLGLGYDSNIFLAQNSTGLPFASLGLSSEIRSTGDIFQFFGLGDADFEYVSLFQTFHLRAGGGMVYYPVSTSQIKLQAVAEYNLSFNYSLQGEIEYQQDLGDFSTGRLGYSFTRAWGIAEVTNENSIGHEAWLGWNADILYNLIVDVEGNGQWMDYTSLQYFSRDLTVLSWGGKAGLTWMPGPFFSLVSEYNYTRNEASEANLQVISTTNMLAYYNDAEIQKLSLKAVYDAGIRTKLTLGASGEWYYIFPGAINETRYSLFLKLEYYLNPSWKLELPLNVGWYQSDLSGSYERFQAAAHMFYLF